MIHAITEPLRRLFHELARLRCDTRVLVQRTRRRRFMHPGSVRDINEGNGLHFATVHSRRAVPSLRKSYLAPPGVQFVRLVAMVHRYVARSQPNR